MAEPTGAHPDVVQAHRFELIDREGRMRGLLGELPNPDEGAPPIFGICLFDTQLERRVYLSLDDTGPSLAFDAEGNNVLQLGVNDDVPDVMKPGAYAWVADATGNPVVGVRVSSTGECESILEQST